jgi:hypothetical protein
MSELGQSRRFWYYGDSALNSSSQCNEIVRRAVSGYNWTACIARTASFGVNSEYRNGAPGTIRTFVPSEVDNSRSRSNFVPRDRPFAQYLEAIAR